MRGFREAVAGDGWAYDLKRDTVVVLREKWQNLVELVERARPAVDKHERQDLLVLTARWAHVDEVYIQSCIKAKAVV